MIKQGYIRVSPTRYVKLRIGDEYKWGDVGVVLIVTDRGVVQCETERELIAERRNNERFLDLPSPPVRRGSRSGRGRVKR